MLGPSSAALRHQGGTDVKERFYAAVVGEDGSVVLVGNAGEDVVSFAAVKVDQDGKYLWEWQVTDQLDVVSTRVLSCERDSAWTPDVSDFGVRRSQGLSSAIGNKNLYFWLGY